jgi:hypothetical protein
MTKEIILIMSAIISLFIAFYAIALINKLNVRDSIKQVLYWTSIIIPVLGLILALQLQKSRNSNG